MALHTHHASLSPVHILPDHATHRAMTLSNATTLTTCNMHPAQTTLYLFTYRSHAMTAHHINPHCSPIETHRAPPFIAHPPRFLTFTPHVRSRRFKRTNSSYSTLQTHRAPPLMAQSAACPHIHLARPLAPANRSHPHCRTFQTQRVRPTAPTRISGPCQPIVRHSPQITNPSLIANLLRGPLTAGATTYSSHF